MADVESYSVTPASNTGEFPEGQAPSTVNDGGRQVQADVKIAHNRINGDITVGGTADALTAAFTPAHTAHVAGRVLVVTAAFANATTTPTFTLDALAVKTITKNGGQALVAGDIYGAGHELILKDAGTYYELMNPATSTASVTLTGLTSTVNELNILDGVTSTSAELNILDGVTSTAAELNILDGVTATTAEINTLDLTTGAGTAEASKAVVLDGSKDIATINSITATSTVTTNLTLGGTAITATGAEINTLAGGKPSFSVHRNSVDQANITGFDKIEWTTVVFDTNSDFDSTTNYRFTPTVAGKYLFTVTIEFFFIVSGDVLYLYIYKNGGIYKGCKHSASGSVESITATAVIDMNGTTDYVETFASNGARDTSSVDGTPHASFWTGCKID